MTFTCTLFILSLIDVITFKCYSIKYLIPSPAATAISQIDNRMITNDVKETGVVKDFLLTILSNSHFYKKRIMNKYTFSSVQHVHSQVQFFDEVSVNKYLSLVTFW